MDDYVIQIKNLHTHFFTDEGIVKALEGIDLGIHKGETLGLVGESGCGKSVTALSIMQLIPQPPGRIVKGEILFGRQDLLALGEPQMRHIRGNSISMIFQEPMTSLNPIMRIGRQVAESIRLHQGLSGEKAREQTVAMLAKVGIPDPLMRAENYPYQMSGGMRQRVMIAMALSCNPELLIADEPSTALDVTIQAQILNLMNRMKEDMGTSILLITHDLGVIAEMAQTVAVMYTGLIVEYAQVGDLFRQPAHPYTLGLINSIPKMEQPVPESRRLPAIPGTVPNLLELPEGCSFRNRCTRSMDACARDVPPLMDLGSGHMVRCRLHA